MTNAVEPPPTSIRINGWLSSIRVRDAQQVVKQNYILGICLGNSVAHTIAPVVFIKTLDAGGCAEQPRHRMEGDLAGARLTERGEHLGTARRGHGRKFVH